MRFHYGRLIGALTIGTSLALASAAAAQASPHHPTSTSASACTNDPRGAGPKSMAYFRTWRDYATDPSTNKTQLDALPCGVDVALVFPNYTPDDNAFWSTLKDTYVPNLHAQGTLVVQTVGWSALADTSYPNTQAGYDDLAQQLYDSKVSAYGLDGLDIDYEQPPTPGTEAYQRFVGTFTALSKLLGPQSGTDRLLILDTNVDGTNPAIPTAAPMINYLLEQSYGRSIAAVDANLATYSAYLPADKYVVGFSFYEENGADWGDTTTPMQSSRAWQFADWGATRGGFFSYAVDRDGVPIGDNNIEPTDYSWTSALTAELDAKS